MERYHALIKNFKHIILYDKDAKVQFVIKNRGHHFNYLGLGYIDLYSSLTKNEWLDFNVYEDNAIFLTNEEMLSLLEYLEGE